MYELGTVQVKNHSVLQNTKIQERKENVKWKGRDKKKEGDEGWDRCLQRVAIITGSLGWVSIHAGPYDWFALRTVEQSAMPSSWNGLSLL